MLHRQLALAVCLHLAMAAPAAATGGVRTVALTGQPAPGLGPETHFGYVSTYVRNLNKLGHVVFDTELSGSGIGASNDRSNWLYSRNSTELIVQEGSVAPGTNGALFNFPLPRLVLINDTEGTAGFSAGLTGSGANSNNDKGIWRRASDSTLQLVTRKGDDAPGIGSDITFAEVYLSGLSGDGAITIFGRLEGASVNSSNDSGVWRQQSGEPLLKIAREGDVAAGTSDAIYSGTVESLHSLRNRSERIAFLADLEGNGVNETNDSGIWLENGNDVLELVARKGDIVPHVEGDLQLEGNFTKHNVDLNSSGQMAFKADISGDGLVASGESGLFLVDEQGEISLAVRTSRAIPGLEDAHFIGFFLDGINDAGTQIFHAGIAGEQNSAGVWKHSVGNGLELVALLGDHAPGTSLDTVFLHFDTGDWAALNNNNQGAITAVAGPTVEPGQPFSGFLGLWAEDAQGDLQLILRTGDVFDVSSDSAATDLRVVRSLELLDNQDVLTGNGDETVGQLLLRTTFTDGSSGIFVTDLAPIPIPGDFDGDRDTDGADFLAWQRGESPMALSTEDLNLWQAAFAISQSSALAATATVPEPSGAILLSLGCLLTISRGCHRVRAA